MASMHRLTVRMVAQAKKPGLYPDGAGLYLQVTIGRDGSPRRSWVLRFTAPDGRRREMGFGPATLVDLAAAREQALSARRKVAAGEEPIDTREADRQMRLAASAKFMTFRQCAEAYMDAHESIWRNA